MSEMTEPTPAQVLELLAELREARTKKLGLVRNGKRDLALTPLINELDNRVMEIPAATLRAQAAALAEREAECERLRAGIIELRNGCATRAEVLHAAHTPDPEDYAEWKVLSSMVTALYDVLNSPAEAPQ